ncbi:putative cation-transporting ATPase 1, partial [Cryomyces antarcticus]
VLKNAFSDFRPKDIALRRPDQIEVEEKRRREEQEAADREKERALEAQIEALEAKKRS